MHNIIHKLSKRHIVFASVALIVLGIGIVFVLVLKAEAAQLPPKYIGMCDDEGGGFLFGGVDPGESVMGLPKGKPVQIRIPDFYGKDVYVALGDHSQAVIIAHPSDPVGTELSTTITIPTSFRSGAVSLRVFSTVFGSQCSDHWTEVIVN